MIVLMLMLKWLLRLWLWLVLLLLLLWWWWGLLLLYLMLLLLLRDGSGLLWHRLYHGPIVGWKSKGGFDTVEALVNRAERREQRGQLLLGHTKVRHCCGSLAT
jgi:hypothetical protein